MNFKSAKNKKIIRKLFEVLVLLVALVILWPQAKSIISERETLSSVSPLLLLLTISIYSITPIFSASSYIFLSQEPLSYPKAILVQFANGFTNRLLPSGSGAIATSTSFLKKSGHTLSGALSISVVNNLLGFIAFLISMFYFGVFSREILFSALPSIDKKQIFIALVATLVGVILLLSFKKLRSKFIKITTDINNIFKDMAKHPISTLMALLANIGITITHVICLGLCVLSLGAVLPIPFIAIAFAASITAISVSPTPNGLGITELAISTTLHSFGLTIEESLVAAICYRLATFWAPILPGYIAYVIARRKKII